MVSESSTHAETPPVSRSRILFLTLVVEGGMFVVACVLALVTGARFWEGVDIGLRPIALSLAFTFPMLVGITATAYLPGSLFDQIRTDVDRFAPMFQRCTVLDLFVISALAGIGEEALFRGVLQPAFAGLIGGIPAVILVAILFGAVHPISIAYTIFAAAIGVYLGAIHLWLDNLFVPAAVHGLYDFVALVFLLRVFSPSEAAD